MSTHENPSKTTLPKIPTTTSEPDEIIYSIPSTNLIITITPYPHRPITLRSLNSCLAGVHKRTYRPQVPKTLTPDRCVYYTNDINISRLPSNAEPNSHKNASKSASQPNLQFTIAGDMLWGRNQLFWADVADIAFGLIQWCNARVERREQGWEFSFTVREGDGDGDADGRGDRNGGGGRKREGSKGRGEIATGAVRRKAEYLDGSPEKEVGYDAFRMLFGLRRVRGR
ncbi:MAG: hypothetical protein LQ337_005936 [Flavoplaca oasis]|nr:MAG: hypothetical protein LQ337_005936 [Flavoplaca oasis]